MFAPQPPPTADPPTGWHASLSLRFAVRGQRGTLIDRRHSGPLLVQKPLYPEGDICHVVILHPPAGLAGGDVLDIEVTVEHGAHAVLTTPGATRWYKSRGHDAAQRVKLTLAPEARLDWLPQENILYDDARATLATELTVMPGASALGWEVVVLGRQASGESWARGSLQLATHVRSASGSLWIEQAQVDACSPLRAAAIGLHGLPVMGTLWAVGAGATQELADALAADLPGEPDLVAGITRLEEPGQAMLLLRVLGAQLEAVRRVLVTAWTALRPCMHGVPARPLRLWAT